MYLTVTLQGHLKEECEMSDREGVYIETRGWEGGHATPHTEIEILLKTLKILLNSQKFKFSPKIQQKERQPEVT